MKTLTKTRLPALALAILLAASGCAQTGSNYRPTVDKSISPIYYEEDLAECQAYAKQRSGAATGLVVGAVLGAAVGAALAGNNRYRRDSIAYGTGLGATMGAAKGTDDQQTVITRCMSGRGYSILF